MKSFYKKFLRYFNIELNFRISLLLIVLLSLIIYLEKRILYEKEQEGAHVREAMKLVHQIPFMQAAIDARQKAYMEKVKRQEEEYRRQEEDRRKEELQVMPESTEIQEVKEPLLQGVSIREDVPSVLIDGVIYEKGQKVDHYLIVDINVQEVILEDENTGEIKKLFFKLDELMKKELMKQEQ